MAPRRGEGENSTAAVTKRQGEAVGIWKPEEVPIIQPPAKTTFGFRLEATWGPK